MQWEIWDWKTLFWSYWGGIVKRIENSRDTPFEEHLGLDLCKCVIIGVGP